MSDRYADERGLKAGTGKYYKVKTPLRNSVIFAMTPERAKLIASEADMCNKKLVEILDVSKKPFDFL